MTEKNYERAKPPHNPQREKTRTTYGVRLKDLKLKAKKSEYKRLLRKKKHLPQYKGDKSPL